MSKRYFYHHSGLVIGSQMELPEWEAFACADTVPHVRILLSDEPCPDCPADDTIVDGDSLRFAIEGIGGWQIEGGHTITLHPGLTTAPAELRLYTLGSAWGALGYQRGFAMWHGSAVERDGGAVLFCGDTGAGKSTIAAALVADGARLVADDLSRIDVGMGGAVIYPSSARIKLWREAIGHFGWEEAILQRDYFRDDKFHCSVDRSHAGGAALPLVGIVILREAEKSRLERLSGAQALEGVMGGTLYRPEMLDAMGIWGAQGALAAQIIANVPVYRFDRSKDFTAIARDLRQLDTLWQN